MLFYLDNSTFFDSDQGIDLSIPLRSGSENVNAWYCDDVKITPVMTEQFTGDVTKGGPVNFRNIQLNPHGNGTHTECLGHISKEFVSLNKCLKSFHFLGRVITVSPQKKWNEIYQEEDEVITREQITEATVNWKNEKVLIIRTLPNDMSKKTKQYSNTNPPYLSVEAMKAVNELGVEHFMIDLPSVDREVDEGKLEAHHTFWNYPENPQFHKTISELLFIPQDVQDDTYVVNVQITSLENDASPSKIMIYPIRQNDA